MRLPEVVLKDAAALMASMELARNSFGDGKNEVCMVGAISMVTHGEACVGHGVSSPERDGALALLLERLERSGAPMDFDEDCGCGDCCGPIPKYSDSHTKDEVLAMLRGEQS